MARGDMTIIDMAIDGADLTALKRVNRHFRLGASEPKWWQSCEQFREAVREGVRSRWPSQWACERIGADDGTH